MKTVIKELTLLKISNAFERENKKRKNILVIAISLSIMTLFLLLSTINVRIRTDDIKSIKENGTVANVVLNHVSDEQYQSLSELNYVEKACLVRNFGIWYQDDRKIAACCAVDEDDFKEMYLPAYDNVVGEYPKNRNEFMASVRILKGLGIQNPEIGMDIPVHIVPYNWMETGAEGLDIIFHLSGYYTDYIDDLQKLPSAFFSKEFPEQQDLGFFIEDALIRTDKLWVSSAQLEKQLYSDIILEKNQNLQVVNEGVSQTVRNMAGNSVFAIFAISLIIFSMNLFLYNIFSTSVNREIRNYGLLKVIGAEPEQMKIIFIFLALKIILQGCIGGILLSDLAVKFVLPKLLAKMYFTGKAAIGYDALNIKESLMLSVILCEIGTIGAFGRCIHTIMGLCPVQCLMYEEKISIFRQNHKFLRANGIASIAWRNFTRNRRKMIVTIGALFIGIEVFLLSVVISRGLDQTNRIAQEPDFEVGVTKEAVEYYLRLNEGKSLEDLKGHQLVSEEMILDIIKKTGINTENIKRCIGGFGTFDYRSAAIKPWIDSWQYDTEIITGLTVQVVSEEWLEDLEKYVEKKGYCVDMNTLKEKGGFVLLHNHELSAGQTEAAEEVIGETLSGVLFEERGNAFQLICCGYLDVSEQGFPQLDMPWDGGNLNYIILSQKTMNMLDMQPYIYHISFDVNERDETEIKNRMQSILSDANQNSEIPNTYYLTSSSDLLAEEQNYISSMKMIMGEFSGILALFALAGYYNTLLAGYTGRKKEITIMRKIGMSMKQLREMLIYEGIFYCMVTAVLLLTLGNVVLFTAAEVMRNQISYFVFEYPLLPMLTALVAMLSVSVFLPLSLYSRVRKESA